MKIHTIGIDLGKTSFHVAGLNERGEVVVRKRFSRTQLLRFTANRKVHLIGMEACGGLAFSGPGAPRAGTRGASDACAVREAVCEDQQK